jgi:hypothetical protein
MFIDVHIKIIINNYNVHSHNKIQLTLFLNKLINQTIKYVQSNRSA